MYYCFHPIFLTLFAQKSFLDTFSLYNTNNIYYAFLSFFLKFLLMDHYMAIHHKITSGFLLQEKHLFNDKILISIINTHHLKTIRAAKDNIMKNMFLSVLSKHIQRSLAATI